MPSSLCYLLLSVVACATLASALEPVGEEDQECPIMDPASIQLNICELQAQVEALQSLLYHALAYGKQERLEMAVPALKQKRKNEFIRFGKRKNEFIRFGKRKNEFIRFGRSDPEALESATEQVAAKRKNEFIRFG